MPFSIKKEKSGLFIHLYGDTSMKEIMACNMQTWEHHDNNSHKYHLWDMSEIGSFEGCHEDAILISKMDNHAFSRMNVLMALVATHPRLLEIANIYKDEVDQDSVRTECFECIKQARKWTVNELHNHAAY